MVRRHPWLGSVGCSVPPPPRLRAPPPLSFCRVAWGAVPLVPCLGLPGLWWACGGAGWGGWEGSLTLARVPSPGVSPWGGRCLHSPSGCNCVVRPSSCTRWVQMDLLCSQVLQPFPTPGSGTLWVAGEPLRDRRVSCLPRWTVCHTRSPSLGPHHSTCRGECSWSGPLVTNRGPLTNGPARFPPYCVCAGRADTVNAGAPKPLRLGPSPASPVGPFRPTPSFHCVGCGAGFPVSPGWAGVVVVGGRLLASPGRFACVRVLASPGCGSPPEAAGGPSPLLAEGLGCGSPPLLAGVLWCWWGGGLRHPWLRSASLWGVVPRFRLWVLGGRSLATPG